MLSSSNYSRLETPKKPCVHSDSERWIRIWQSGICLKCWQIRLALLSVILAFIGAILLSITLFGEVGVNRQPMGIGGVILTMFAIMFAAVGGYGS